MLKRNGLKPSLADTNGGRGTVISHNAVSRYYGGTDHTDPISYFSMWNYDMQQYFQLVQKHYNQLSGKSTSTTTKTSTSTGTKSTTTKQRTTKITGDTYKVKSGDTLYSISQRSGKSIANIKKWNKIPSNSNEITVNQVLKLKDPSARITSSTYNVRKGDTLYSIAKRSGLSVSKVKSYNNLKSNNIYVGQKLYLVPTHEVKYGDTLYRIAVNNNLSVSKLKQLNGLTSNFIVVGQKLVLR